MVRIRANTAAVGAAVATLLGDALVGDDVDLPYAYSIRLEPPARRVQPLHVLYDDCRAVTRSRDPERVLADLVSRLHRAVTAAAVASKDAAVLLPADLQPALSAAERRLNRAGLAVVDGGFTIDGGTGELVVPAPPLIDESLLAGLDVHRGDERGPASPGRYRVVGTIADASDDWFDEARRLLG